MLVAVDVGLIRPDLIRPAPFVKVSGGTISSIDDHESGPRRCALLKIRTYSY